MFALAMVYNPDRIRLCPMWGAIAIACRVVVESRVTGPVYRDESAVGVQPSVV